MSGGFSDAGKADFQARLQRIQASSGIEMEPQPVAAATMTEMPRRREVKKDVNLHGNWKENIRFPLAITGAFLVAILGVFLARYARFHVIGGDPAAMSDVSLLIEAGLAAGIGFVFRSAMKFETKEFMTANAAGIIVAVCTLHNLVHWFPNVYDNLFSPEYTDMVILMTDSNSLLIRGVSVPLGEDPQYTYGGRFEGTEWEEYFQYEERAAPSAPSSSAPSGEKESNKPTVFSIY